MANVPMFAMGTYAKIQPAIEAGVLKYPAYVFVTDTNQLAFVDKNSDIQLVVGDNKKQVVKVDALPEVADGDTEVLYIYQGIVYTFTGTEYKPQYVDYTAEIETLQSDVSAIQTDVTQLQTNVTQLQTDVTNINNTVSTMNDKITALEESVENITDASSGLNFSSYNSFPETGVANQLYIDSSDGETGGIYTYDTTSNTYKKLSSSEGASGIQFIELS